VREFEWVVMNGWREFVMLYSVGAACLRRLGCRSKRSRESKFGPASSILGPKNQEEPSWPMLPRFALATILNPGRASLGYYLYGISYRTQQIRDLHNPAQV
jgi:hypothetical protein